MFPRPRARLVLLLSVAASVSGTATASAAPTWLAPAGISDASLSGVPRVAIDAQGATVSVWGTAAGTIEVATRPAGAGWQRPRSLGTPGGAPLVAADSRGTVLVAWAIDSGVTGAAIRTAVRTAAGTWQPTRDIVVGGTYVSVEDVSFDARDVATIHYDASGGPGVVLRSATGAWQGPIDLTPPGADDPRFGGVTVDASGRATVVWAAEGSIGSMSTIQAAVRRPDGRWLPTENISAPQLSLAGTNIASDAAGNTLAVWSGHDGMGGFVAQSAFRPAGGGWQAPVAITPSHYYTVATPQVAFDARGNAIAVWSPWNRKTYDSIDFRVMAAYRPAGGSWQPETQLTAPEHPGLSPALAMNPRGDALVVWPGGARGFPDVQGSSRPASTGVWSAAVTLSRAGEEAYAPSVALGAEGDGAAVFRRATPAFGPDAYAAEAAGFDAAGPRLDGLTVPPTAVAGAAVDFAVSPSDAWSALGATTWAFGDATSTTGTTVTHTYDAPGTYAVTVTASDLRGNSTTATRTLTVSAPIPEPRPGPGETRFRGRKRPGRRAVRRR